MLKISAVYFMWNPEICQDPPTCDQDDLVLSMSNTTIRKNQMTKSGIASSISFFLLKMAIVLPIFFLYKVFKIG